MNVNANGDNEQDNVAAVADDDDDDDDADENDVSDRATIQTTAIFVIQFHFLFIYVLVGSLFVR